MRIRLKIGISTKLIVITFLILMAAIIPLTIAATNLISDISQKREEDTLRDIAQIKSNQLEVWVESQFHSITNSKSESSFDNSLLALAVFSKEDGATERDIKPLGPRQDNVPLIEFRDFLNDTEQADWVFKRFNTKKSSYFILGFCDESMSANCKIGLYQADSLLKLMRTNSIHNLHLFSDSSEIIASSESDSQIFFESFGNLAVFSSIINQPVKQGLKEYKSVVDNSHRVAAFAKTKFPISILLDVDKSVISEPARYISIQIITLAGIVLSISLTVVFIFSLTISRPIYRLVGFTRKIARGIFDLPIMREVSTNDEVGLLAMSFENMMGGLNERDRIKNLFTKFQGSEIASSLMSDGSSDLKSSKRDAVVFFSDLRSFTAMVENMGAEEVVAFLNDYFSRMVKIIIRNGGIVDKFIGDAIMAVWGAPKTTGNDCRNAVKACLEMRLELVHLNKERIDNGLEPVKIGIGLHFGTLLAGPIGSDERMEYTVIGDTVNTASRIEEACKSYGVDLIISESVAKQVDKYFSVENIGEAKFKGKTDAFQLFSVTGKIHPDGRKEVIETEYSSYLKSKSNKVNLKSGD